MPPYWETFANFACDLFFLGYLSVFSFEIDNLIWIWLYQLLCLLIYVNYDGVE